MVAQTLKLINMNTLIYCDSTGIIEKMTFDTAEKAILNAKITIREYQQCKTVDLIGLMIEFVDGSKAVYNNIQKSECLLNIAPPALSN